MMHIVMLSDGETQGGAALAASRLAEGLCGTGHKVTRIVRWADEQMHPWHTVVFTPSRYDRFIPRLVPSGLWQSVGRAVLQSRLRRVLNEVRPDVINVHNLHGAMSAGWSAALVGVCAAYAPTVWTLHDMWSFTGRCAFSYDCRNFLNGCDSSCPTPTEYPAFLPKRISDSWKQRQRLYEAQPNLVAVSPSRWLAEEAKAGLWAGHRIEVIPNGLRLDVYRPLDRLLARQALGIDTPGPVLMFAAHGLLERRKGLDLMIAALPHLSHRPLTLLILGSGRCPIRAEGVHVHSLGYVDHERTKVLAYNAADVFVHPAIADNLPNTVMESLACATPVVAFPIGGVPDMVRPGLTGWLASEVSPMALANVLADALTKTGSGVDLRGPCRAAAEVEFSEALQAQRYLSVFRSLGGRDSES